jgi:hypothetical protein
MKTAIAGLLVAILSLPAFSDEGRWTEGYGQGNLEYFMDRQGFRLYIACSTEEGEGALTPSVSLQKLADQSEVNPFTITVDGLNYDAPFEADSRVGSNNFISLMNGLRKGSAVVKFGNMKITFPKSNAAKVIPKFGTKEFGCYAP